MEDVEKGLWDGLTLMGFLDDARNCTDGVISTSLQIFYSWSSEMVRNCPVCHWKWQKPRFKTRLARSSPHCSPAPDCPPSQSEMPLGSGPEAFTGWAPEAPPPSLCLSLWGHRPHSCSILYPLPRVPHGVLHPERHRRILRPPLCLEMQIQVASSEGKGGKNDFFFF